MEQVKHFLEIDEINLKIAEFIRIKREERKLTIRKFSRKSKISTSILSRLEGSNGFNNNPTIKTLNILCYELDTNLKELFLYVYREKKN